MYVNALASVALCPSGLMTVTSTVPVACAGVVTLMAVDVEPPRLTTPSTPPKSTRRPELALKFVPLTVRVSPPDAMPEVVLIDVTVGALFSAST
jgi:hypothetical protein